jgi:hypothetical protein
VTVAGFLFVVWHLRAGSGMYPFHPQGKYRPAEGWVNYGARWCTSSAYLKFDAAAKTLPTP